MSKSLPDNLTIILKLLDELLDLPRDRRDAWFDSLTPDNRELAPLLRDLLSHEESTAADLVNPYLSALSVFDLASEQTVGPYRLERLLGRGGMAEVWLAERADGVLTRRQFALKLPHNLDPRMQQRLYRERDILGALTHAGIARLYDAGVSARGRPYLAMEYIEGVPLPEYCTTHRASIAERLALFSQVLDAVHYAHTVLVIHRDLKPSNILVTASGKIALLDFGIAKLLVDGKAHETELTQMGGIALTPSYASPEQIVGLPLSTATDVYSLGVNLFELLTGQLPYRMEGRSRRALEDEITQISAPRASQSASAEHAAACATTWAKLLSQLSGDLDAILARALRKTPTERYSSVKALQADLERYLSHEPVQARKGARAYVFRLYARRHWKLLAAAATLILSLVVGVITTSHQAHLARVEARKADAVKEFVLDIFHANSTEHPDGEKARHTTAEELLDISRQRIFTQLRDQPEVRQEMVSNLISLYNDMQSYDKTVVLARTALESLRQNGIGSVQQRAQLKAHLGLALAEQDQMVEGIKNLEEALAMLDRQGDRDSTARVDVLLALGEAEWGADQSHDPRTRAHVIEAQQLLERCCAGDRRNLHALQMLARIAEARADFGEAERHWRRYVALARTSPFAKSAPLELADALSDLGAFLFFAGRYTEAQAYLRESLDVYLRLVGNNVLNVAFTKQYLGQTLTMLGKPAEGAGLLDDAIRIAQQTQGVDNITNTVSIRTRAAAVRLLRGDISSAGNMLAQNMLVFDRQPSTPDSRCGTHCASTLDLLADLALATGNLEQAGEYLLRADAVWRAVNAPHRSHWILMARWHAAQGKDTDALSELDEVQNANPLIGDGMIPAAFGLAAIARGEILIKSAAYQEAAAALNSLVSTIGSMPYPVYYSDLEARARRLEGIALAQLGQLDEAQSSLRRAVELRMNLDVPSSPWLAEARLDLASVLIRSGAHSEIATLAYQAQQALHTLPTFERYLRPQLQLVSVRDRHDTRRASRQPY